MTAQAMTGDPMPTLGEILDAPLTGGKQMSGRTPAQPIDCGSSRRIDKPEAGWWLMRLTKNGPLVPAAIIRFETRFPSDALAAFIGGERCAIEDVWLRRGQAITEQEYRFRLADQAWLREYRPNDPQANPRQAINLNTAPIPFLEK